MFNRMKCYVCGTDIEIPDEDLKKNVAQEQYGFPCKYFLCEKCYKSYVERISGVTAKTLSLMKEFYKHKE